MIDTPADSSASGAADCDPDPEEIPCAPLLKALADETRLDVVKLLLGGERRAGELRAALDVEQSLLSHHLRQLREAGIVVSERDGKGVLYRLSRGVENRVRGQVIDLGCCQLSFGSSSE